jgi:hypothetical protein
MTWTLNPRDTIFAIAAALVAHVAFMSLALHYAV